MYNDEVEDASFYNTICSDNDDNSAKEVNLDNDGYDKSPIDRHSKFKMVHKRWDEFYNYDGSKRSKQSMTWHLYREKFGEAALSSVHM